MNQEDLEETSRFVMDVLGVHYNLWLQEIGSTDNIVMHRTWWDSWRCMSITAQIAYLDEIMHCAMQTAGVEPCKTMHVGFDLLAKVLLCITTRIVRYELASMSKVGRQNTIFAE